LLGDPQGKKTRDEVRAALFKAVFGTSAYRALISRHRRRHVGGGTEGEEPSSSSTDSDEGGPAGGAAGAEDAFDEGT
jgi:hypothetical protein